MEGFPETSRDRIVRVMLEECNKGWEEHVKLTVRQVSLQIGIITLFPEVFRARKTSFQYIRKYVLNCQGTAWLKSFKISLLERGSAVIVSAVKLRDILVRYCVLCLRLLVVK